MLRLLLAAGLGQQAAAAPARAPRHNVLMLAVDDLRADFGASFGSPEVRQRGQRRPSARVPRLAHASLRREIPR